LTEGRGSGEDNKREWRMHQRVGKTILKREEGEGLEPIAGALHFMNNEGAPNESKKRAEGEEGEPAQEKSSGAGQRGWGGGGGGGRSPRSILVEERKI